jgi:hypothetical protein
VAEPPGVPVAELRIVDAAERADLANFVGRAVRLSSSSIVRLRPGAEGTVGVWASTRFDVIVARSVRGSLRPADTTVRARELLTALAVLQTDVVHPGQAIDAEWRSALPPGTGFVHVDDVPAAVVTELVDQGVAVAQEHPGPTGGPSSELLDQRVLTVRGGGQDVAVPLRCLFALSGMGFVGEGQDEPVRVRVTRGWLRLDARYGSVLRRRHPQLPLLLS